MLQTLTEYSIFSPTFTILLSLFNTITVFSFAFSSLLPKNEVQPEQVEQSWTCIPLQSIVVFDEAVDSFDKSQQGMVEASSTSKYEPSLVILTT